MAQIFVNDIRYMHISPMKHKLEAGNILLELIQDIGIPLALHCDGAQELQYCKWKQQRDALQAALIKDRCVARSTSNSNTPLSVSLL
jgi:hypothetical protein